MVQSDARPLLLLPVAELSCSLNRLSFDKQSLSKKKLSAKHIGTSTVKHPTFRIKACVTFLSSLCRLVCDQYAVARHSYLTEAPVSVILPTSSVFDTSSTIYFRSAPLHLPDESSSPFHRTLNTVSFEYSTFGWFAHPNCMVYAAGLLPSLIQHS